MYCLRNSKYFSVLIFSYINTSGNSKNCVETPRPKDGVFSWNFKFFQVLRVLISIGKNVLYFYNIAQKTLAEKRQEIFRVDNFINEAQNYSFISVPFLDILKQGTFPSCIRNHQAHW